MTPPAEAWQGRADHNEQMHRRSCCSCGRSYTHDEMRLDFGWEPLCRGWRCGSCGRRRRREARGLARSLIERTEPRWALVLASPLHSASDECLPCEAVAVAGAMLLRWGALTRAEASALREAVSSWPAGAAPAKRCAGIGNVAAGLSAPSNFLTSRQILSSANGERDEERPLSERVAAPCRGCAGRRGAGGRG
jgi:hypothetical protein